MNTSELMRKYADIITEAEQIYAQSPELAKQKRDPEEDGTMSPIHGSAFAPYDRKADPRTWFRKDVKPRTEEK